TDPEPMPDPLGPKGNPIGVSAVEHRIACAELFDKAAVAGTPRIRDDDAVIGTLLCATARKANFQRHADALVSSAVNRRAAVPPTRAAPGPWAPASSSFS